MKFAQPFTQNYIYFDKPLFRLFRTTMAKILEKIFDFIRFVLLQYGFWTKREISWFNIREFND